MLQQRLIIITSPLIYNQRTITILGQEKGRNR